MLSGNRLRVDALRLRIGFSKPVCPSRWPRGISIAVSEPNCPSQPVSDSLPGLKTLHSEPAGPSELALWLNFGFSEPKHPTCTPIQGPPGLKIAVFDPARPFRRPLWLNFGFSKPKLPSCTPLQGPPGLKIAVFDPQRPSRVPLWLNFGFSEPKHPTCTPLQGPPGLKIALPEPARPFPVPLARVAGPEQERAALSAVADSGKPLPLQPFGSACPSTRSGCAVPCGPSRSQARVPSLPGPANPATSAPGEYQLRHSQAFARTFARASPRLGFVKFTCNGVSC